MVDGHSDTEIISGIVAAIDSDDEEIEETETFSKGWLDPAALTRGRADEMRRLDKFDVYTWIREENAYGRVVDAKWVERDMEGAKSQEVRSRICGR